jgi:predicted DNA-binding WGR domain protein
VGIDIDLMRIDASDNTYRYYRMEIAPGLFGDWALVREWGRVGQPGQVQVDWYDTEAAAKDARFDLLMKKAKRGYE